jgi:hypothetical protein
MLEIEIILCPIHNEPKITLQSLQIFNTTPQPEEKGESTYVCTLTTYNVRGNPFRKEQALVANWPHGVQDPAALVAEALARIVSKR